MSRLLALILLCLAVSGCELIADFDRSKIPERPAGDAGTMGDAAARPPDAGRADAGTQDASTDEDAGEDDAG